MDKLGAAMQRKAAAVNAFKAACELAKILRAESDRVNKIEHGEPDDADVDSDDEA